MSSFKTLTAVSVAALALAAAGTATAQTPYYPGQGQTQTQTQTQPNSGQDVLGAIIGALFGNSGGQSLDEEWRRGRRPLINGQAQFQTRLDAAVRDRTLSSRDAADFRADYDALVRLETSYYADRSFSSQERNDLSARYTDLARRYETAGTGGGYEDEWRSLADGRVAFDARVDASLRARDISRAESTRLKTDYAALVRLETTYQRDGFTAREQADLQSQLDALNERVGDDYDGGYGGPVDNRTRIAQIETAIAAGERSGAINRNEGERLRTELGDLTRLDAAYAPGGLNADESAYLSRRLGELDMRVRNTRR